MSQKKDQSKIKIDTDPIDEQVVENGKISDEEITALVREHFDLRPRGLIEMLDLRRPIYQPTASYGHFGRNEADFTWEKTDKVNALKKAL